MRFLFVMDPVATVNVHTDTSFALMLEAERRGHRVDHCLIHEVGLDQGRTVAQVRQAHMERDPQKPITLGAKEPASAKDYDAIWIRKDPPFDSHYLWATQVLERAKLETVVINDPKGLREANEKLYACHFPELMAETIVTNDPTRIYAFVDEVGGKAVLKPIAGKGGEGIMVLGKDDVNMRSIVETMTELGQQLVMVQRYLPEIRTKGDKRILLLNAQPFGMLLRLPAADDIRSNLRAGGTAYATDLSAEDKHIVETLAPRLIQDGLWFVGLDVIGGKLTEVNVTSPTGLQQMCKLMNQPLDAKTIDALEQRIESR